MGRHKKKSQDASQTKKVPHQIKSQVENLTEIILQKCTSLSSGNVKKEWEDYQDIHSLMEKLIELQKGFGLSLPERQNNWEEFMIWCTKNGATCETVEIKNTDGNEYGLITKEKLPEGELFLTVPRKAMITTATAKQSKLGNLIEKDPILQHMPNVVLALHLLTEYCDPNSFWLPYISILPSEYNTPLYFTCEELNELQGSPAIEDIIKLNRSIARQYAYFYKLFQSLPNGAHFPLKENFTYAMYRWAVSTVMTRQNLIPTSDESEMITALIPLWDMCNHSNGKLSTDYSTEKDSVMCYAMKSFDIGEQVYIFYGPRTNSELFLNSGFVYPGNQNDNLTIKMGISKSDPLFSLKSQLCSKVGLALNGSFQLLKGSYPVDSNLLCFLQILVMSEDDLKTWLEADASQLLHQECSKENNAILKAMNFLKTRLSLLVKCYPTTLEDDEAFLQSSELTLHKKMAIQLRIEEKLILKSALEYLSQFENR